MPEWTSASMQAMRSPAQTLSPASTAPSVGIAKHYLRYLSSNVLVVAAGFLSFPLMARLLDNRQFGLLGYYEAWLLLLAGLLKLGAQHSVLRFYPRPANPAALAAFRSNHILLPFGLSLALWLCCLLAAALLAQNLPAEEQPIVWLLLLSLPLLIWSSLVESVMYALERSDLSFWLKTSWRWSELLLVLGTLAFLERSAIGVLGARTVVLVLVALLLTRWLLQWLPAPVQRPERAAVMTGLAFGLPMMASELSGVVFGMADRILLRGLTGSLEQVGIYTIGFGLAMALGMLLGASLNQAFTPTALRRYELEGSSAVLALKRRMLDNWVYVVALFTALLLCGGADALVLLAGKAKAASAPVFVIISICLVWHSLFEVANYGLLLQRRAMRYLSVVLAATMLKLLLSVPLILHLGVLGAALATAVGYVALAVMQFRQCPPTLRYLPPTRRLLLAAALPLLLLAGLQELDYFGARVPLARLIVAATWVALAALVVAVFDPQIRRHLLRIAGKLRKKAAP